MNRRNKTLGAEFRETLLAYLVEYEERTGKQPSFERAGLRFGLSTPTISKHVALLVQEGRYTRHRAGSKDDEGIPPAKARAIQALVRATYPDRFER